MILLVLVKRDRGTCLEIVGSCSHARLCMLAGRIRGEGSKEGLRSPFALGRRGGFKAPLR